MYALYVKLNSEKKWNHFHEIFSWNWFHEKNHLDFKKDTICYFCTIFNGLEHCALTRRTIVLKKIIFCCLATILLYNTKTWTLRWLLFRNGQNIKKKPDHFLFFELKLIDYLQSKDYFYNISTELNKYKKNMAVLFCRVLLNKLKT